MVLRVDIAPGLLEWAQERSRVPFEELASRNKLSRLPDWLSGQTKPTLNQLEDYAAATHTPVGFLFLPEPPDESVPIPDFRTHGDHGVDRPSADLLDTIYICQKRQEWYRDHARSVREEQVAFVGSASTDDPVRAVAATMREVLGFELAERRYPTWMAALGGLAEGAEDLGVLVMINGIVGSNAHRRLDPQEFRGFALVDPYAPLVFVNGADTKAAQIFTLAHELAHIWLGREGLDDAESGGLPANDTERWCSRVAAECLVPLEDLRSAYRSDGELKDELDRLARRFKVSTLVVLRRVYDAGFMSWDRFRAEYAGELHRVVALMGARGSGGNFYDTTPVRTSKRFARALLISTLEGQTLYRDAANLLGFKNLKTLDKLAAHLGVR